MNPHIQEEIAQRHPTFEFRGTSWERGGLNWIRGLHRTLNVTFYFCVELECGADTVMYEHICKHGRFC